MIPRPFTYIESIEFHLPDPAIDYHYQIRNLFDELLTKSFVLITLFSLYRPNHIYSPFKRLKFYIVWFFFWNLELTYRMIYTL